MSMMMWLRPGLSPTAKSPWFAGPERCVLTHFDAVKLGIVRHRGYTMGPSNHSTPLLDALEAGIIATGTAALDADFDSARLSLAHVRELATNAGLSAVVNATGRVIKALGPPGGVPTRDLGQAIIDLGRVVRSSPPE
ncbi:hypothetical protein L2Y96_12660 [Luteibacter aegosomaticola]|uniref:hypothetical protein n=1 Tax=Luteibacter aegosomaticola TaxID=2911538 RepID=UPI001FF986E3|nr:hypothetical protein [Luteibacter aegosomaticola]UPG88271.1 hypothetical protein L2Y96_12660 [Luteibacter aegosomaticola]